MTGVTLQSHSGHSTRGCIPRGTPFTRDTSRGSLRRFLHVGSITRTPYGQFPCKPYQRVLILLPVDSRKGLFVASLDGTVFERDGTLTRIFTSAPSELAFSHPPFKRQTLNPGPSILSLLQAECTAPGYMVQWPYLQKTDGYPPASHSA